MSGDEVMVVEGRADGDGSRGGGDGYWGGVNVVRGGVECRSRDNRAGRQGAAGRAVRAVGRVGDVDGNGGPRGHWRRARREVGIRRKAAGEGLGAVGSGIYGGPGGGDAGRGAWRFCFE